MDPKKPEGALLPIEDAPGQTPLTVVSVAAETPLPDASRRSDRSPSPHQSSSSDSSGSSEPGVYRSPSPFPCPREPRLGDIDKDYDPAEEVFSRVNAFYTS